MNRRLHLRSSLNISGQLSVRNERRAAAHGRCAFITHRFYDGNLLAVHNLCLLLQFRADENLNYYLENQDLEFFMKNLLV